MSFRVDSGVYIDENYRLHYPDGASLMDGFPDELRDVVDNHWEQFPPQHPMIIDFFGVLFFFLWCICFFGNALVIYVFLGAKELRTPTNLFIVNLAFSDLCMMTTQGLPCTINAFTGGIWMYGALMCKIYACIGGIFGTTSLLTMVAIGYDRYNVIVKGIAGFRMTYPVALLIIISIYAYSTLVCIPPFLGWGGYALEGLLVTCSYDYMSTDWNKKSFLLYAFIGNYCIPMTIMIFFYTQIVKAVVMHEAALKAQAKKMNVDSLRSNAKDGESAEVKIAKVAVTNVLLWVAAWTPYATVAMIGCFGTKSLVTPLVAQIPSMGAKMASCFNPVVFALNHPKYRQALTVKCPCLGIKEDKPGDDTKTTKTET